MQEVLAVLREFGFPILVCVWFMWRMEKLLNLLVHRINKLITINTVLVRAIDADVGEEEDS